MALVLGGFEALQHLLAGETQGLAFTVARRCLRGELSTWRRGLIGSFCLLCFNGLAFPSSSHSEIIRLAQSSTYRRKEALVGKVQPSHLLMMLLPREGNVRKLHRAS